MLLSKVSVPLIVAIVAVVVALVVLVVVLLLKNKKAQPEEVEEAEAPVATEQQPAQEEKKEEVEEAQPEVKEEAKEAKPQKTTVKTYHISARKADSERAGQKDTKKDQMWQVKLAGGQRALKLFATQAEAIEYAKALCENNEDARIVIHKEDGTFRRLTYKK